MTVKVAINGFGRIGRNVLRAIYEAGRKDIEVVAINDLGPVATNAHLLRYDTVHGKFPGEVKSGEDWIDIGRGNIRAPFERGRPLRYACHRYFPLQAFNKQLLRL